MSDKNYSTKLRELYTPDIIDEVVTFANSDGGVIYIGIREDSTVLGIADPTGIAAKAAQDILTGVRPDISPILQVRTVQLKGKDLVAIMVGKGTDKPYSRIGAEKAQEQEQPEAPAAITPAPVPANGFNEADPCTAQLTFSSLSLVLEANDIAPDPDTLSELGLIGENGFTNIALLLSEQCPYNVKVTMYDGCDKGAVIHSSTIGGSLLRQIAESCRLIEKLLPEAYPEDAVSEAVTNALVHRDYAFSGSTIINIFSDRLEIVSLGGLPAGLSMESIEMGIALSRYPKLADTLSRIGLMEGCGSGLGRIRSLYSACSRTPEFNATESAFRVILPNISTTGRSKAAPDGYKALVLQLAGDKGFVVRSDVEQLAGLKTTAAYNLIKELVNDGLLIPSGVGKKTIYKPV